jgi:hypothetical protein
MACWCGPVLGAVVAQIPSTDWLALALAAGSHALNVGSVAYSAHANFFRGAAARSQAEPPPPSWGMWVTSAVELTMVAGAIAYLIAASVVAGVCVYRQGKSAAAAAAAPAHMRRLGRAFGMLGLNSLTFFPTYDMLGLVYRQFVYRAAAAGQVAPYPVLMSPKSASGTGGAGGGGEWSLVSVAVRSRSPWRALLVLGVYVPVAVVALCLRLGTVTSIVGRPDRTPLDWTAGEWVALAALINNINTMGRTDQVEDAVTRYLESAYQHDARLHSAAARISAVVDVLLAERAGLWGVFRYRAFGLDPRHTLAIMDGFTDVARSVGRPVDILA